MADEVTKLPARQPSRPINISELRALLTRYVDAPTAGVEEEMLALAIIGEIPPMLDELQALRESQAILQRKLEIVQRALAKHEAHHDAFVKQRSWRDRSRELENAATEQGAQLSWIGDILAGKEVSDFALSFPLVHKVMVCYGLASTVPREPK
jgi:hypothetical protein